MLGVGGVGGVGGVVMGVGVKGGADFNNAFLQLFNFFS